MDAGNEFTLKKKKKKKKEMVCENDSKSITISMYDTSTYPTTAFPQLNRNTFSSIFSMQSVCLFPLDVEESSQNTAPVNLALSSVLGKHQFIEQPFLL